MAIGLRLGVTRDQVDELGGFADDRVDAIIRGAIDLHVHPGPSPLPRRMGIVEAARDAARYGLRAIVAKSHHHSMLSEIQALRDEAGLAEIPVEVIGGIALNHQVGGLNPYAVELALALGGRVVWLPTIASAAHLGDHGASFPSASVTLTSGPPIRVVDERGAPLPATREILDQVAAADALLSTGHLGADEIEPLLPAARAAGVRRILISHPDHIVGADPVRVRDWTAAGAFVEFCVGLYDRAGGLRETEHDLTELLAYLDVVPADRAVLSSDVGQRRSPRPVDTLRRTVRELLDRGLPDETLRRYVVDNPTAALFGDPTQQELDL